MQKILYIANHRLPTEKAYGIQIAKMCEAFASRDANVRIHANDTNSRIELELAAPYRKNNIKEDIFDYYGIKRSFKFKRIRAPDFYLPGKLDQIAFKIKYFISAIILSLYALIKKPDIIYSRDELPIWFLSFFRKSLILEMHNFSQKRTFFYKRIKSKNIKAVAISNGIARELEKIGFDAKNTLVAFDAVDLKDFDINISKTEARKKINLPLDKKIALYSGHFFKWKGADTVIEAAPFLKEVFFVFVGGIKKPAKDNILFLGHKPHKEIPLYLKAADVLILPNLEEEKNSKYYTSPLKLFEYMASSRPIIASDLPSIREVLDEESAVFFEPGNPEKLAQGINKVIQNQNLAESISTRAFDKVENYTWAKRTERILKFIG